MNKKLEQKIMAVVFLVIIFLFGAVSDYKLMDYYVNDVAYNEYWNPDISRKNETEYSVVFWGKREFIDINGGIRRLLGQRMMNNVCKLDNGQLTELRDEIDDDTLKQEAENISGLYEFCQDNEIPFVYIAAPDKISPYDSMLPVGETDSSNENTDRFVSYLDKMGVPNIDLRYEIHRDGIEHYSMFSKTDHHWNAQGGYYAYTKIREWMDKNGILYDERAADCINYDLVKYENKLLGSWGQRTGRLFTGCDDFYVYYPCFDTSVTTEGVTGEYKDVLLDESELEIHGPGFIYDSFYPNMRDVYNNTVDNDTVVMLIGDSFSREVNPFIILSERDFVFRQTTSSALITKDEITETKPDAIILMQSPWNNLGNIDCFSYFANEGS